MQFQDMARFTEMDYWPRTGGGCMAWNRPCYFLEPCQSRNREMLTQWFLMGDEPAPPRYEIPWITAEIDVFGENADG